MVKEEGAVDVEEGEISDAMSIEEISEEDFKQDAKDAKEASKPKARVWTMQDLYRYQVEKGYTSGLHNLAWAQAVQKKPLSEIVVMDADAAAAAAVNGKKGESGKGGEKVVIDDSGDEGDGKVHDSEKEEGELEEGEIDLDSEVVDKVDGDGGEATLIAETVSNGSGECEMELGEEEVERRIYLIQEALDSVMSSSEEISFEEECCRLQGCLENLKEVVLVNSLTLKDALIQLFLLAIQGVHAEFCLMDSSQKEQNKDKISRLLSLVKSNHPSFFSSDQAKEIEDMICYLNAIPIMSSAKAGDREKDNRFNEPSSYPKNSENSSGIAAYNLRQSSEVHGESLLAESTDQTGRKITLKALKLGNSGAKARGMLLPLLDLHKDHDEDSLPSPTQQAPPSSRGPFLSRADGIFKPEMSMSMGKSAQEAEAFKVHPYETDAVKAVDHYQRKFQQKFGSNSFSNDRLPSPTPSEEHENGVDDTSGEVSSSSSRIGNTKIMNAPNLGRPVFSSLPHVNNINMQGAAVPQNHAVTSSGSNLPVKSSGKSRDPRLRFANSDSGNLDLNQRPLPVIHGAPRAELLGGSMIARKQRNLEDPALDGPATKRLRNGFENSGAIKDMKTGGWLEDPRAGGYQAINRNNPLENASDLKRTDNGVIYPSIDSGKSSVAISSSGNNLSRVASVNPAAALPALLKDIAVNPTMLMNLLKMGQQQKLSAEAQQNPVDPSKNMSSQSNSASILGAAPKVTLAPATAAGSGILQKPAAMLPAPTPVAPVGQQDELGKIRMKPRDPRRVLHGNMLQRTGSMGTEQLKHTPPVSRTQTEDLADRKTLPSESSVASDVSQKILKHSKNIPVIMSSSQSSTNPVPASQTPMQSTSGVDAKTELPNHKDKRSGTDPLVEVSAPGPSPSQSSWGDLEHIFEGYDDQQRAAIQRERARRMEEQRKMFAARKLCLVLDLDHTLLNSAKFGEVEPVHEEILRKKEEQDRAQPQRHLFRFIHMGMWTKLRPGIWNFLEKASKLYELHLYTMGNKLYATEMAKVLDPKGVLFAGRVISRGDDGDPFDSDDRCPKSKDLEGVLGMESSVVIIDDSVRVWPHNKLNLIVVERYTYFPCSRRQFGLLGPSLLEIDHDERPEAGTLASSLAVIERIHQDFFAHQSLDDVDVRNILAAEQQKILGGCRIVFSRIFPVGEANPQLHPLWQTAEQFGATCTNQIDDQVTHVVANSLGTDKVNWALSSGRFVVHPGWVEASALLYRRANEQDFAIKQ
ncbi:RNA polymerase II C-terminal domain phosphatase-like 3 [Eucalyptus grandis]|uniref:RNA polymerase II C-terminal domain phosphatase-like 3 n=1 Tax=Eucalyptus grandis TaxID=71139 RepID=UPI00192F114F|nr:RNA polymerase II C-terminal domain phosphatase-like 3 [Eucalyptus grandis]